MNDGEWAAREAPKLVEEAREAARAEARELLKRRMVDALLRAADEPDRPAGDVLWVYGIVAEPTPEEVAGVDGAPVQAVTAAGLTALTSTVAADRVDEQALEDMERLEAVARAHQHVLDRALAQGGVVPFRICTLYSGEDHVRAMLERERPALVGALERLRGAAEWGVKAHLVEVPATATAPGSGTAWLERKRDDRAAEDEAEERAARIHARLAEHASAATLARPHDRQMLLNGAYLVPVERSDELAAVVAECEREHGPHGVSLELTGPWPPFHFVAEAP